MDVDAPKTAVETVLAWVPEANMEYYLHSYGGRAAVETTNPASSWHVRIHLDFLHVREHPHLNPAAAIYPPPCLP